MTTCFKYFSSFPLQIFFPSSLSPADVETFRVLWLWSDICKPLAPELKVERFLVHAIILLPGVSINISPTMLCTKAVQNSDVVLLEQKQREGP